MSAPATIEVTEPVTHEPPTEAADLVPDQGAGQTRVQRQVIGIKGARTHVPFVPDSDRSRLADGLPEGAIHLSEMDSPAAVPAHQRLDPYWDGVWGTGSGASWISEPLARRQTNAGLGMLPRQLRVATDEARDWLESATEKEHATMLALLGGLYSWRTLTCQQSAALTGAAPLASSLNRIPSRLFASGAMDLGIFVNGLIATEPYGQGALYRASKSAVFNTIVKPALTWVEWVGVTGGQEWTGGSWYDRHNTLAAELALRASEYTDIGRAGTVLGERFAAIDMLAGTGAGRAKIQGDQAAGDLVMVRPDGLRIVVEVTASTGKPLQKKIEKWARRLADHNLADNGLVVLFVVARHPFEDGDRRAEKFRLHDLMHDIAASVRSHPGSIDNRVAERIAVANWDDWFPARHAIDPSFTMLRAARPTGRAVAGGDTQSLWEDVDLLDPIEMAFEPRGAFAEQAEAVIANSALLGQTPHWIRQREREAGRAPELWRMLPQMHERTTVPDPSPIRPDRPQRRGGLAGLVVPPRRLR